MKVGHLIHLDGPGGGADAVVNLVRGLRDTGLDQVVFHGGKGRIAAACADLGVPCIQLPISRKSSLLQGFVKLVFTLRRIRPDVLLMQGQWAGPLGALAACVAGVKTIYIAQWPAFYTDWTPFRAWRNAWAEYIPCRLSCRVVALTPSVYYQYLHRGWAGDEKLIIIPNVFHRTCLPTKEDAARIRRVHAWAPEAVHVVSVGRLVDQKRVDWLLKAWPEVQDNCPSARLWIVGDGAEKSMLEGLADRLGIRGTCSFLGACPRGIEYMAAADVVVMTSLYESFGYVALEAKACAKPVIANAVDGVRDNVKDGVEGYLVAPNDIPALSRRLVELINNPALRLKMGVEGALSLSKTDEHDVIVRYRDLIEMEISSKGSSPARTIKAES